MSSNKQKILEKLKALTRKHAADVAFQGIETSEIADALDMRRNAASQILNELVQEKRAAKTNTRPVLFRWLADAEPDDPFSALVGADGSLKQVVEQCRSAAFYPGFDMPVLLIGPSGVGKSYMAKLIYRYAKAQGRVAASAPFIVFNCADYAANPELLSANLFGYKKGAFTGAAADHAGTLEAADGGYLFLDEVHRLPPDGQEKLFVFMDQGVLKRIGESKAERRAQVRLVFATTEEPREALLATFVRRIPMTVRIPGLENRPIGERLVLIYRFFQREAVALDREIQVSRRMINYILSQEDGGNIGSLRNLIKFLSARAYKDQRGGGALSIDRAYLRGLPDSATTKVKDVYREAFMRISKQPDEMKPQQPSDDHARALGQIIGEVDDLLEEYREKSRPLHDLKKNLTIALNRSLELMVYSESEAPCHEVTESLYLDTAIRTLKMIESAYGIKYYGNTGKVLARLLMYGETSGPGVVSERQAAQLARIHLNMEKSFGKVAIVADKIIGGIEYHLDIAIDRRSAFVIELYVFLMMTHESIGINGIIAAHGYSTASSIASVANQLFSQFIFEAFDMPIQISPREVAMKIRRYLKQMPSARGTILLVDMGSLMNLEEELRSVVHGDLGIINNITTNIALEAANRILQGESVKEILAGIERANALQCKFVPGKEKKKAILTTCISGIGTAVKLRDILLECIGGEKIAVEACEYGDLHLKGREAPPFQQYDVRLILSTTRLAVEGVPCILLQELMEEETSEVFMRQLSDLRVDKSAALIRRNLVKMFSLENLLTRLTILNPDKIINEVEQIIANYERRLGAAFSPQLKISLYLHISVLIERLMLHQGMAFDEAEEARYKEEQPAFIDLSREIFAPIAKEYHLTLTLKEIHVLQTIMKSGQETAQKRSGWDE